MLFIFFVWRLMCRNVSVQMQSGKPRTNDYTDCFEHLLKIILQIDIFLFFGVSILLN